MLHVNFFNKGQIAIEAIMRNKKVTLGNYLQQILNIHKSKKYYLK